MNEWIRLYGDLQWTAGIIEGEGSIVVHKNKVRVSVSQKDPEILYKLQRLWGGKVYDTQRTRQILYSWDIYRIGVYPGLLMTIYPLMSIKRQGEILRALVNSKGVLTMTQPMMYTNPRLHAQIDGWPYGQYRTTAHFSIEQHPTRGQRGIRTTVDPKTGRMSKPKTLTYAAQACIVDGEDGKTYILELTKSCTHLSVMQSNMQFQQEAIFPGDPRFADLLGLLKAAA